MRDLLRTLAAHGRTILVSSHLLPEMELLADDLIIIAAGRLAAQGTPRPSSARWRTAAVPWCAPRRQRSWPGRSVRTPSSRRPGAGDVYITGVDAAAIGDAAQRAGIAIHQLTTERPDLEAVFLELTAGQAAIR